MTSMLDAVRPLGAAAGALGPTTISLPAVGKPPAEMEVLVKFPIISTLMATQIA